MRKIVNFYCNVVHCTVTEVHFFTNGGQVRGLMGDTPRPTGLYLFDKSKEIDIFYPK